MSSITAPLAKRRNRRRKLGDIGFARIECRGGLVVGDGLRIENEPIRSHIVVDSGATLTIGRDLRMAYGCGLYCGAQSTIGNNVVLQAFVSVIDSDFHVAGNLSERPVPRSIHIGDDVVLGCWSVVLPGTVIGHGAVAAAGSVLSGRVAGAHGSGNPAAAGRRVEEHDVAWGTEEVNALVVRLMTDLFDHPVDGSMSRDQIEAWDSLGSVRLLGALEESFPQIALTERRLLAACSVGDIVEAITSAAARSQI